MDNRFYLSATLRVFLSIFVLTIFLFTAKPAHAGCSVINDAGDQICGQIISGPTIVASDREYFDITFRITLNPTGGDFRWLDAVTMWFGETSTPGFGPWSNAILCQKTSVVSGSNVFSVSDASLSSTDIGNNVSYRCRGSSYSAQGSGYVRLAGGNGNFCRDNTSPGAICDLRQLDTVEWDFSQHGNIYGGVLKFASCNVSTSTGRADIYINHPSIVLPGTYYLRLSESNRGARTPYSGQCQNITYPSLDWLNGVNTTNSYIGIHHLVCGIDGLDNLKTYYFQIVRDNVDNGTVEAYCPITKFEARLALPNDGYTANAANFKKVDIKVEVQTLPSPVPPNNRYTIKAETESGNEIKYCLTGIIDMPGTYNVNCDFAGVPGGPAGSPIAWPLKLYKGNQSFSPDDLWTGTLLVEEIAPGELGTNGSCGCTIPNQNFTCPPNGLVPVGSGSLMNNNCYSGTTPLFKCVYTYQPTPGGTPCNCSCSGTPDFDLTDFGINPTVGLKQPVFNLNDFAGWMGSLHNYLIAIGVIASVFMLPYAFVLMGTGDVSNIKKGQEVLKALATGLIVLILSGTIIRIIAAEIIGI